MGHDALCLISGIRPRGGPRHLVLTSDLDRVVTEMTDEIKAISETTPTDLVSILREPLALAAKEHDYSWKPPGLTQWHYFDICVAIGYFSDRSGHCEELYHNQDTGAARAPGGRNVAEEGV